MRHFELLATDLDGTLFGRDLVIRPRTRAALTRWVASGRRLVIATGRMYRSAAETARALDLDTPIICYQGALVRCPRSGNDLVHHPLPPDPTLAVLAQLEAEGFTVLGFRDDALHARREDAATRAYTSLSRVTPVPVRAWGELFGDGSPTKIVAVAEPARVRATVPKLRRELAGTLHVVQSLPAFLEIVHPQANKGAALTLLCKHLGVPLEATVGVGDGHNDLELVSSAGLGVAMQDGHPELVARADHVTGPLRDEGLADLVEWLLSEASEGAWPPR
ncbi:MAG: Cof-type HAD-IIB family hydrolase [Candidatus Sericytochromatia bacterium]|nr:Cof-type HAD-IIB family hydrolase [Candidatus Sericytochromatia bacterium]